MAQIRLAQSNLRVSVDIHAIALESRNVLVKSNQAITFCHRTPPCKVTLTNIGLIQWRGSATSIASVAHSIKKLITLLQHLCGDLPELSSWDESSIRVLMYVQSFRSSISAAPDSGSRPFLLYDLAYHKHEVPIAKVQFQRGVKSLADLDKQLTSHPSVGCNSLYAENAEILASGDVSPMTLLSVTVRPFVAVSEEHEKVRFMVFQMLAPMNAEGQNGVCPVAVHIYRAGLVQCTGLSQYALEFAYKHLQPFFERFTA